MTEEDNKHFKMGLNFRKIIDQNSGSENPNNIIFSNGYIGSEGQEVGIRKYFVKIGLFFHRILSFLRKFFILDFIFDLTQYLYERLRVIVVLASVAAELFGIQLEFIKRLIIKRMFWGRSSLFNVSLQFLVIFVVLLVFISNTYRKTVIADDLHIEAETASGVSEVYKSDVFVQNSSTKTQINKDAGRIDPTVYIVKGGDTLSTIAEEYGLRAQTLMWANDLNEGDFIRPGMELLIPQGDGVIITVKEGDTVESLAEKYDTLGQLIVDINALEPPYTLSVGAEIFLPEGVMPEPPKPVYQAPIYSGIISAPSTGVATTPATGGTRWLRWPVASGGMLTQCYSGWHNGIDIADKSYPSVVAAAPGTVTFSGCQSGSCPALGYTGGYGLAWTIVVDHGNGYSTVYGHLNNLYVSSGQSVSAGQAIGQMGQSGTAYGIHVHFMVVYSGTWTAVNPAQFMSTHVCGY